MNAKEIATALGNARRNTSNNGYLASCPVSSHGQGKGDKNPSLSISDTDDDVHVLFKCFGGCSQNSVFNAIKDLNLLPTIEDRPEILSSIKPLQGIILEQSWNYTDEDGSVLFVKHRYKTHDTKGKTYKLMSFVNGRQIPSMKDVKIVPYQLPELLDAVRANRVIYICEGEKAADAVRSLKLVATTCHGGASSWFKDINPYFQNASVVILPDNDAPGHKYARTIVRELLPFAKKIRIVNLPDLEHKEDAFEWVNKYSGSREDLAALARQAPVITEEIQEPETIETIEENVDAVGTNEKNTTGKDIPPKFEIEHWSSIQDEPVEWLIEGVLPKKGFAALYGPPASFKSFIALDIADCITSGRSWMNNEISNTGAVLYICGEGHGGIGSRLQALKSHHRSDLDNPLYVIRSQINLRSSQADFNTLAISMDSLIGDLNEKGIELQLVIVDTLNRSFGGGNENSSDDMGAWITGVGNLQRMFNVALMVLHHSGKDVAKGLRGHSSLLGAVDTELEILRFDGQPKGILTLTKQKDGEDGGRFAFKVVTVKTETTSLGLMDQSSSLAIERDESYVDSVQNSTKKDSNRRGQGPNQRLLLKCLGEVLRKNGQMTDLDNDKRVKAVHLERWRDEFKKACGYDMSANTFNKNWTRRSMLIDQNLVGIRGDFAWIVIVQDEEFDANNVVNLVK